MIDDPYGSFDDMAGLDRGDSVSEGSDRGDGEWGEFDYLGDLGNAGGTPPRAQASSFDSRVMAAEGTALPGTSEGSRPPASGKGDLGAVSLRPCSEPSLGGLQRTLASSVKTISALLTLHQIQP